MRQRCGSTPPAPEGHQNVATGGAQSATGGRSGTRGSRMRPPEPRRGAGAPPRFSDASLTKLFPDPPTKALVAVAVSTSLLAGCQSQVGWDTRQVRCHLAEDFCAGMEGFQVLETLHTYPIDFDGLYAGSWPSPEDWQREFGGEYEPWRFGPRELANSSKHWTGPSVFVADLEYVPARSWSPAPHTYDPAQPDTVWFELSDDLRLRRWGHTLGEDVRFFPEPPATGDRECRGKQS